MSGCISYFLTAVITHLTKQYRESSIHFGLWFDDTTVIMVGTMQQGHETTDHHGSASQDEEKRMLGNKHLLFPLLSFYF